MKWKVKQILCGSTGKLRAALTRRSGAHLIALERQLCSSFEVRVLLDYGGCAPFFDQEINAYGCIYVWQKKTWRHIKRNRMREREGFQCNVLRRSMLKGLGILGNLENKHIMRREIGRRSFILRYAGGTYEGTIWKGRSGTLPLHFISPVIWDGKDKGVFRGEILKVYRNKSSGSFTSRLRLPTATRTRYRDQAPVGPHDAKNKARISLRNPENLESHLLLSSLDNVMMPQLAPMIFGFSGLDIQVQSRLHASMRSQNNSSATTCTHISEIIRAFSQCGDCGVNSKQMQTTKCTGEMKMTRPQMNHAGWGSKIDKALIRSTRHSRTKYGGVMRLSSRFWI